MISATRKITLTRVLLFILFGVFLPLSSQAVEIPLWLDFNDSNNNTRDGYVGVSTGPYSPSVGYGWDKQVSSFGYWSYDYNYHVADGHRLDEDGSFFIDVANGEYTLYLEMMVFSRDSTVYDSIDISVQGELRQDNFSPVKGKHHVKVYDVTVTANRLSIAFQNDGGAGSHWLINSLRLQGKVNRPPLPEVAGLTGNFSHKDELFIEGIGFGLKIPAAPLLFDDFEWCSPESELSAASQWQNYRIDDPALCSSQQVYSGKVATYNHITSDNGRGFATAYFTFPESDSIYLTYKTRYDVQGNGYGVRKLSRVTSKGTGFSNRYNGNGTLGINNSSPGCETPGCSLGYKLSMTADDDINWSGASYMGIPTMSWSRVDMYAALSTPGVNDGRIKYAKNMLVHWFDEQLMTRGEGEDFKFHSTVLGLMMANAREDGRHWIYIDDLYLDSTRKRVEICDQPSWEKIEDYGGVCEPQIPTAWSDTSISITVNVGHLDLSGPLYLFVVNEDGLAGDGFSLGGVHVVAPRGLRYVPDK